MPRFLKVMLAGSWFLVAVCSVVVAALALPQSTNSPSFAVSLWPNDVALTSGTDHQGIGYTEQHPGIGIASDGLGGAIIAWDDLEHFQITAQRLSATGEALWGAGVPVGSNSSERLSPSAVSDGVGGAIIVWFNGIYDFCPPGQCGLMAQRSDPNGQRLWNSGVIVDGSDGVPTQFSMIPDGSGGAIVGWGGESGVVAQRIGPDGTLLWQSQGVVVGPLDETSGFLTATRIASDGAGGAIFAFAGSKEGLGVVGMDTVQVQRVNAQGDVVWTHDGVTLGKLNSPYNQDIRITSDGNGGAIVGWDGIANNAQGTWGVTTQRLDGQGDQLWSPGGVVVATGFNPQLISAIASDGAGGAVLAWDDPRNAKANDLYPCFDQGDECDIYAQRVGSEGAIQWTPNGVPIVTAPHGQFRAQLTPSNEGSVMAVWADCRDAAADAVSCGLNAKQYLQVLLPNGAPLLQVDGIPVSTAPGNQGVFFEEDFGFPTIATTADGSGGALLAWPDGRDGICLLGELGGDCNIFAQHISVSGSFPVPSSTPTTAPTATSTPTATPTPVMGVLELKPNPIEFGSVRVGSSVTKTVVASSPRSNGYPVQLTGFSVTGNDYKIVTGRTTCAQQRQLVRGGKCQIAIQFNPSSATAVDSDEGSLAVQVNTMVKPVVKLLGTGKLPPRYH